MGKRGPKPLPTQTLKVRGSWRADVRKDEPQAEFAVPNMPDWLSSEAEKEWNRLVLTLNKYNLLTDLDGNTLGLYCQTMADYQEALEYCKEGVLIKTENGNLIQSPAVGLKNKALQMLQRLGAEFGFSPSSRAGMSMPKAQAGTKKKESPFKVA